MIIRINKEQADELLNKQINRIDIGGEVLVIGNGRFYLNEYKTEESEWRKFIHEWERSGGKELPSFKFEEEQA